MFGIAAASVGILAARSRPILLALVCWAAVALCVTTGLLPAGAAICLTAAVLAAILRDRMPAGLAWALFAWLSSIAAGWMLVHVAKVPASNVPEVLMHTGAALAAWWMLAAGLARQWPNRWARDARAAFLMTAIIASVVSLVLLGHSAVGVTYWRLTQTFEIRPIYLPSTAWQGLIDIALLLLAAQLSRRVSRWEALPSATFWLVLFGGAWWGLMLPPPSTLAPGSWPMWLTWLVWLQTAWSWSLLGAVLAWVWQGWRRQERAWPNDLAWLVRVPRPWPGLVPTAIAVGLAMVPLGLWHTFSARLGAVPAVRLTTWDMAAAGLALAILVGWHWDRALAELALSLWTTALTALAVTTALEMSAGPGHSSLDLLPTVYSAALVGLACAGGLWFWLGGSWQRQLQDGRAWTTAGRMLPLAERVGFLATALGVLVGTKLALWPHPPYGTADNSTARLVLGSGAYVLLAATCLFAAVRARKGTMLWLAGLTTVTWGLFLKLRWFGGGHG